MRETVGTPEVLIVSHLGDDHAVRVQNRLSQRGVEALVLDTSKFPQSCAVDLQYEPGFGARPSVLAEGRRHDLGGVHTAWWRRPQPMVLHDAIGAANDREFAFGECHAAMTGLWACLDAHWVNQPERDEVAARKAYQLKVADRVGLRTPRTLITNDPASALGFVESEGERGTIYKAFSATEHAWRETRLLRDDELGLLDAVQYAPVIFQEYVKADIDLRITVIGDRIFPAEILSGKTDYLVDFRMRMDETTVQAHELPASITERLFAFMDALGLVYGAIDMRVTPDGEYVFLEVNTAGQWLFMEERTGQPITEAMVDYLAVPSERRTRSLQSELVTI